MTAPIYLDGLATLPLAPEAREALVETWSAPGNATSPHQAGERAAQIIALARSQVADLIGAAPSEVVFTSGATEANNLAILGVARGALEKGDSRRRILVSAVEHKAVLEPARALEREGFEITVAPVDRHGRLDLGRYADLLDDQVLLASVMAVNNETGIVEPVNEACGLAHDVGALFHCDAAQAAGKITLNVLDSEIDYLSISAHKCYGPMGIGALYVSATAPNPAPLHFGGGQQRGIRPGTEPVGLAAGFGAAVALAAAQLAKDQEHCRGLAELLFTELQARQLRVCRVTGKHEVVSGGLTIVIDGVDADYLCAKLAGSVQLSTGSACTSGQLRTSHVLEAMGFSSDRARMVVRAFCHRYLNADQIVAAAERIGIACRQSAVATGEVVQ